MFSKSILLLLWNVNVGECVLDIKKHLFFKLDTENAENYGSVQLSLNRTLTINSYQNKEYHCRGKLDDDLQIHQTQVVKEQVVVGNIPL